MKPDKLEIPEIQLSMRDVLEIYQRGGRITRSTRAPNSKPHEPKSKDRHKNLIHYLGDPCLSTYLQNTNIKYKQPISTQYFVNKKLRRLNKQHLPQNCLYYEKSLINQQISYRLRFVKLNAKKSKTNQYFIEQTNRLTSTKSLNIQDDAGVLTVTQSVVLYFINFQEFQKTFEPILLDLKKNYKAIKIDQLSRVSEQKQSSNLSIQNQQRDIIDNEASMQIESISFPQKEIKAQENSKNNIRPLPEEIEAINKEIAELDKAIFNKMCLPNLPGILWPCIVLQPLVGEKDELEVMVYRKLDQSSKDEYRSSRIQVKLDEKVFHSAFEDYLDELGLDHSQKAIQKDKPTMHIENKSLGKIENTLKLLQNSKQSKIFVNLLGTHETRVLNNDFIKWQDFDFEQIQQIIMKTPFRGLVDELNDYIECLNKFKKLQDAFVDGKHSLYRLCKYQNEKNEIEICLPLRNEQSKESKEEKKVLVRFLRDEHPINPEEHLLQWIEHSKLRVNFTFPKHNEIQKKFYYILGNNISIEEGINYIYSDFHFKTCNFNEVLRLCYPLGDLRKVKYKEQRCISCYYQIQNLSYFRCKFCLRFCHQECTAFKSKPHSQAQTSGIPLDIYQTQNDDELWNCSECAPCVECQMAVKDNFIQCFSCKNVYHPICGKLKGLPDQAYDEDKYTCENCLKCRMCNNKVKYQQYCIEGKNIFCVKCYKDYSNNEYCALCMKEAHGDWVQCDQRPCEKWIHISCDSYFKEKKILQPLQKLNYSCPNCRKLQKRKIFRNIIEQLKFFDEYQYFYEPDYEELTGYKEAIKIPICIYQMRQKALEGAYDNNAYSLIKADLELLVKNAMTFNMPKDEAHYRAKILLVVGTKYLTFFKDIIECSEQFLVNHVIEQIYLARKKQFYNDLYEHYLEYLLNFKQDRGMIEVKKYNYTPYEQEFFSSKIILSRIFSNAQFTFIIKQKPHKIENLFTIPRLSTASWWPIRLKTCFYHPDQLNPIIYQCKDCLETYCCIKKCFNHRTCNSCSHKGCGCDSFECQCPTMKEKDKKLFEAKIHSTLSQSKLQKRQYTQYYKYCLKCVSQNLKTNWCYLCHNFCYYAYEKCTECNKVYHLNCQKKNKWQEMSIFFDSKSTYKNSYHNVRLPHLCYNCSYSAKNSMAMKEKLTIQSMATASKLSAINKFLPIFNYIYELNGIRLAPHQVTNLIAQNFQDFSMKERYLNEFLINFSIVIENMGNNRIAREQFRQYFMNEITRKLSGQNQHEKIISIVQTKQIKQLKQSKKFYKIYSKWFNSFYYPCNFISTYEIKYHLEHLTSKVIHHSGLNIGFSHIYQFMITDHHHMFAANFREENHLNSRNFERLKIQSITTHVSPKSKKNIYYTNKLQKYKLHLLFFGHYYNYKARKIDSIKQKSIQLPNKRILDITQFEKALKQYEKYFRFHSDYENLTDCIYKEESSKTLLSEERHFEYFNPFHENTGLVKYNKLSAYREHDSIYINNKSQMLYKYLSHFALKIFQQNKVVLKKGNTSILSESKRCWRILKRIKNVNVEIKLEKRNDHWILNIGEWSGIVKSIEEIIKKLKQICPIINSFEDIANFMGFGMTDSTFYEPNHFTHLLQTLPLDSFNRKQRKRQVMKVYDRYQWQRQGNFVLHTVVDNNATKFEYNVTKKDLFYLKKRNQVQTEEIMVQPKVIPFITYEDIKKDLEQPNAVVKEKQNFIAKEPTNDVYIAPSKIDRLGLFIRNYTKKNTVVAQYIGQVISEAMADIRQQKFHFGCYMFSLGKNNTRLEIIDATFIGNMARYLNHSCDPNCKAKIQNVNGQPRILIYTIKDVKENDELTYDYQFKIDANERLTCKCKSKNCQGRLT